MCTAGQELVSCPGLVKRTRREEMVMAIDPVCRMEVDENSAPAKSEYKGKTYYFCAPACKRRFEADPEKFLVQPNVEKKAH